MGETRHGSNLQASARRTSGSECGSWHSPTTENRIGCRDTAMRNSRNMERLDGQVYLSAQVGDAGHLLRATDSGIAASWPTPTLHDAERGGQEKRAMGETRHGFNLQDFALTSWATWPTPCQQDGPKGGPSQGTDRLPAAAHLASWPTPMAGTPAQNGYNEAGNTDSSRKTVALASWPTPTSRDHKDAASTLENTPVNALLGRQALGTILSGSPAPTEKRGQLNPAFSRWLMGFPAEWDDCAPTATRSSLRPRPNS